jgi:hypothetical protein
MVSNWAGEYDTRAIRQLLLAAFGAEELRRFCMDRPLFRPIINEFGPGQGKADMVDRVIDYCDRRQRFADLLKEVQRENPRMYEHFRPYFREPDAPFSIQIRGDAATPNGSTPVAPAQRVKEPRSGWRNWGDHPVVVALTVISTIMAIVLSVAGVRNLPELLGKTTAAPDTYATASPPPTSLPAQLSHHVALRTIYGDDAAIYYSDGDPRAYASWTATEEDVGPGMLFLGTPEPVVTQVLLAFSFRQEDMDRYFLITATMPESGLQCTACAPVIGGGIFVWQDGGWRLDIAQKNIASLGFWGVVPDAELKKIGPDRHGILLQMGYVAQGYSTQDAAIIAQVGQTLKLVFLKEVAVDNEGTGCWMDGSEEECWKYDSQLTFEEGQNRDYFDLHLTTHGTRWDGEQVVYFEEETIYVFNGSEYVPIQ